MHKIDSPHATAENEFTDGDEASGILATELWSKWFNTVQRELIAVLTAASITPSAANDAQVVAAIQAILGAHIDLVNNPHSVTKEQVGLSNVPDLDLRGRFTQNILTGTSASVLVSTAGAVLVTINCGTVTAGDLAFLTGSSVPAVPPVSRMQWLSIAKSAGTAVIQVPTDRNDYFAPVSAGGMTASPQMRDNWPMRVTTSGTLTIALYGYVSTGDDRNFTSNQLRVEWIYKQ